MFEKGDIVFCVVPYVELKPNTEYIINYCDFNPIYPNNQMINLVGYDNCLYNTRCFITLKEYRKLKLDKLKNLTDV